MIQKQTRHRFLSSKSLQSSELRDYPYQSSSHHLWKGGELKCKAGESQSYRKGPIWGRRTRKHDLDYLGPRILNVDPCLSCCEKTEAGPSLNKYKWPLQRKGRTHLSAWILRDGDTKLWGTRDGLCYHYSTSLLYWENNHRRMWLCSSKTFIYKKPTVAYS